MKYTDSTGLSTQVDEKTGTIIGASNDGSCYVYAVPTFEGQRAEDPARDGTNWYGYCGNNPVMYTDLNGLETWNSTTLTKDEYNKNYQLQRQYSWEQIQQHFTDNPKGIIYRYDTVSYSLGKSNRDFPNMEEPSARLVWGLASIKKWAGFKLVSWIKSGVTSSISSGLVDTAIQYKNMAKTENLTFNTTELFNSMAGGFMSGFISRGTSSISGAGTVLPSTVGGFSGSMISQMLYNAQNGEPLFEGMEKAYMYGTVGGIMVGGINTLFPSPLPANIGQVIRDSLKDEIISTATGEVLEEKLNETRSSTGN